MIQFHFDRRITDLLEDENISFYKKKQDVFEQFQHSSMIGWTEDVDSDMLSSLIALRDEVKKHSQCLVVVGIGGSYLGSYAINQLFSSYFHSCSFPIIYVGTTLSSDYLDELFEELRTKDFSLFVVSKSGNTMETVLFYQKIKRFMEEKYSLEELRKRIIICTNLSKGYLREQINQYHFVSFSIPENIGGRFSLITPAHLFPLSFSIDIFQFVSGYFQGKSYQEEAYRYAFCRKKLFDLGKVIENFCVYDEKFLPFTEWLKQLFAESEGKEKRGIFPVSTLYPRDLHSLGQFVQEGNPVLFETFFQVDNSSLKDEFSSLSSIVFDSVIQAHCSGGVYCNLICISCLDEFHLGELMYFFMMSATFSSYLFEVDPFDQPGVEVYKNAILQHTNFDFFHQKSD